MPDIFISPETKPESTSVPLKRTSQAFKQAFSSYIFMPEGVRFETQEHGETIILLLRKHWIVNFIWLVVSFALIVFPVFIFPIVFFSGLISWQISSAAVTLVILVWYLLTFSYVLINFLLWYFTVSIVTSERIVDIDFVNILHKKFAATGINKIEDVTMRTGGFIRALVDYGDVFVQTAAKEAMFQFEAVPHPEMVVRTMNKLMGKISGE